MLSAPKLDRRSWLAGTLTLTVGCARAAAPERNGAVHEELAAVRDRVSGRLGVSALDTHTGARLGFDEHSRYAMASTFKLLLAGAVLARVDRQELRLEQQVAISARDLVAHAPVTERHVASGQITVEELCAATVVYSDNPAANLLLPLVGGPSGLTAWLRALGDPVTRLDRTELELNTNEPGDPRDTTTPRAMVDSARRLVTGNALTQASRERLAGWLMTAQSGVRRIRAGVPAGWKAGDKTGTGQNNAVNDVAVIWPPGRAPIVLAIYMSGSTQPLPALEAAHAEITRLVIDAFSG